MKPGFFELLKNINSKRRALSQMMGVIILVGITVAIGGVLAYTFIGQTDTLTQSDSVTPSNVAITKVGAVSYISANIKNTGNTDVNNMEILVEVDTDSATSGVQPFEAVFSPALIQPGQTGTVKAAVIDNAGVDISMTAGSKILVTINGTTANGGSISYPSAIRVR